MKFLPLIWRNAVRNRLRTFLTLAGIAFLLFVLIFVMTGLSEIQAWEGVAATHRRVVVQIRRGHDDRKSAEAQAAHGVVDERATAEPLEHLARQPV